jgi:hypothetical protein
MGRAAGLLVLLIVLAAGSLAWRDRNHAARQADYMSARREFAATRLAPVGAAPQAGVSARAPIRVRPIPRRLARELKPHPDFQRFSHRCGVCHGTPDPALHGAAEWTVVVDRMAGVINSAGLLPLTEDDRAAVLRVLAEHAAAEVSGPAAAAAPAARRPPAPR